MPEPDVYNSFIVPNELYDESLVYDVTERPLDK